MSSGKRPYGTAARIERATDKAAKELVDLLLDCTVDFLLTQLVVNNGPTLVTKRATIISPSGQNLSAVVFMTDPTTAAEVDEFLKTRNIQPTRKQGMEGS